MGQRLSSHQSGYDLFQIAPTISLLKIVLLVIVFLFAGGLLLLFARCFSVNRLVGFVAPVPAAVNVTGADSNLSLQYLFFYISALRFTSGVKAIARRDGHILPAYCWRILFIERPVSCNKSARRILEAAGVMVVNVGNGTDFSNLPGGSVVLAAFILSAARCMANVSQTVDPMVMTGYQLGIGGLVLVIGGYVFGGTLTIHGARRWRF